MLSVLHVNDLYIVLENRTANRIPATYLTDFLEQACPPPNAYLIDRGRLVKLSLDRREVVGFEPCSVSQLSWMNAMTATIGSTQVAGL